MRTLSLAIAVLLTSLAFAAPSAAQSLPAMRFVTAPLVDPGAAETFYGTATIHTNSVPASVGNPATSPEVVETARALKGDPDLIFEYVHNQVDTEFAFGERKGPVGTLIDKSGTPFDQNALFVDLVRQGGKYAANLQIGEVVLNQAQFQAWTGVSDVGAACRLLSSGGIAASFAPTNPPPSCAAAGSFTSVTILTVWSEVQIGGTWYYYDPSFKTYAGPAPVNIVTASGFTAGSAAVAAASGMSSSTSGAPWIKNVNAGGLDGYVQGIGTNLLGYFRANDSSFDTDTVLGITKIQPVYFSGSHLGSTTAPGVAYLTVAGDVPDQFRTQLQIQIAAELDGLHMNSIIPTTAPLTLYVDDIDGRRLGMDTNFDTAPDINPAKYFVGGQWQPYNYTVATESLVVDDVPIASYSCNISYAQNTTCLGGGAAGQITLTAVHPYAASATAKATFADETVVKPLTNIAAPVAIVSGWGRVSPARLAKWSDEVANDKALPRGGSVPYRCEGGTAWCFVPYLQSAGDLTRQKLAASWLAQMTRMIQLQTAIADQGFDIAHSIGVVDWRSQLLGNQFPPPGPGIQGGPSYDGLTDEFTDLNIDTVLAITPKTGLSPTTSAAVAAVSRSVALASATLEGSVLEQMEDLPDTASTASRFAWGNQPETGVEDPCLAGPRRFYDFTAGANGALLYEGFSNGCTAGATPYIIGAAPSTYINNTDNLISSYITAWTGTTFHITGSAETFLGPGARFGPAHAAATTPYNDPSQQRGGAIIATQWDGAGNVLQVAHVLSSLSGISKGGGGKQPQSFSEYDPSKAADVLKDRFVDRSVALGVDLKTGTAGYTTPTLLSLGAGQAPYKLDYGLAFKAAPSGCAAAFGPCTGPVEGGWNQSWDVRFTTTGSGLEAMGATSPFEAAGSLVAFMAMQDIFAQTSPALPDLNKDVFAALVADWWRQQMVANVATVNRGFSGAQYVRLVDGNFMAPVGAPGTLTQSGQRVKVRDQCQTVPSNAYAYSTSRRWDSVGPDVTYSLTSAAGDVIGFQPWAWQYNPDDGCAIAYGYEPNAWTWPQGPSLTFTYDPQQGVTGISTSLGRSMTFTAGWGADDGSPQRRRA